MLRNLKHIARIQKLLTIPTQCSLLSTTKTVLPTIVNSSRSQLLHTSQALQKYDKKSSRSAQDAAESDDEDDAEFKDERDSKVIKTNVNSLRADVLLKSGLGMARK